MSRDIAQHCRDLRDIEFRSVRGLRIFLGRFSSTKTFIKSLLPGANAFAIQNGKYNNNNNIKPTENGSRETKTIRAFRTTAIIHNLLLLFKYENG